MHTREPPWKLILPEVFMNHFSSCSSELRFVYEKQGFIRTVNTSPHVVQPSYSTVQYASCGRAQSHPGDVLPSPAGWPPASRPECFPTGGGHCRHIYFGQRCNKTLGLWNEWSARKMSYQTETQAVSLHGSQGKEPRDSGVLSQKGPVMGLSSSMVVVGSEQAACWHVMETL